MQENRVSELSDHLGFWLRAVSNQVSLGFARKLDALEISVAEWVVMRTLYDRTPMAPSQIADDLGMTRGAITKLANRLIDRGFMTRERDPADGRAQTLSLTTNGAALVPRLATLADENDAEWFGHLTLGERHALSTILSRLIEGAAITGTPID